MAENSKIEWTDHTFNPWRGCSKVAEGCKFCYADAQAKRNTGTLGIWGPNGTRVVASESMWQQPLKWNKAAEKAGQRARVFCASMADVFEDWDGPILDSNGRKLFNHVGITPGWWSGLQVGPSVKMEDVRRRLFALIDATPHLDWLLLTKRPENIRRMWVPYGPNAADGEMDEYRPNVWLGTSVSDQETYDKAAHELEACRGLSPVLFLSVEPLLGPIDLDFACVRRDLSCIDWVIVGGESGPNARPCDIEWVRDIVRQCKAAEVPCFVKQLGAKVVDESACAAAGMISPWPAGTCTRPGYPVEVCLGDRKGGDWNEWPEDLRVREFPQA